VRYDRCSVVVGGWIVQFESAIYRAVTVDVSAADWHLILVFVLLPNVNVNERVAVTLFRLV